MQDNCLQAKRLPGLFGYLPVALMLLIVVLLAPPAVTADELSCDKKDNAEGGCCCFQKTHTYEFKPRPVSRLEVTFDTGRGIGCRSEVAVELLRRDGWQTLRTVSAVSSDGRSQINRLSGGFDLNEVISGVRVGDGGRCYIDYSKIGFSEAGGDPGGDTAEPELTAASAAALASGVYKLEAYSGRVHESVWKLEVADGKITGSSEWDCCPGKRRDRLEGTAKGVLVQISRNCSGQGIKGRCLQVYEGSVSKQGVASGSWSHNGRFAGKWRLDPVNVKPEPETTATRILADPAPPYRQAPVTVDFTVSPGPVDGAVWWMNGRRMTNAEVFFWTFAAGDYEVELRTGGGKQIARLEVPVKQLEATRVEIVPDKKPPFAVPASLTFRQRPGPVAGARWYVDDVYASSSRTLTREFLEAGRHVVGLRSGSGEELTSYEVVLEDPGYKLWGRRQRSRFGGVSNDTREIQLERSAAVTKIEGNAGGYCIWTVSGSGKPDQRVVCGSERDSIAGAILLPGRYVVIPDLADEQRASEVTIHLKSR